MNLDRRQIVVWAATALVLLVLVGLVVGKERLKSSGRRVLLELTPRDPRSLMQGDYMELRYVVADQVPSWEGRHGRMVLRLDDHDLGTYVREDDGASLGADECRLAYKHVGRITIGAESFFFQEGQSDRYSGAQYGELRVAGDGTCLLIDLCDRDRKRLGPAP